MTQFSPKNVALGSLVLGGSGILIATIGSFAGSEVIAGLGLALLLLCFCGLYVAYLLNVLRFWESGAELAAIAFWTIPSLVIVAIESLPATNPARFMGECFGILIFSVIGILFWVWIKKLVKRHILKVDPIPKPETPGYPPMILGMLALTLAMVFVAASVAAFVVMDPTLSPRETPSYTTASAAWSDYTYSTANSPTDTYAKHGISFSYPKGLWLYDDESETGWNTYDDGMVTVQDSGAHESIMVAWWYSGTETPDISDALSTWINDLNKDPTFSNLAVGVKYTRALDTGHTATYIPIMYDTVYEEISPDEAHVAGYLGGWYCDRTDRTILFALETQGGTDVADGMLAAFVASARCH